MNCQEAIDLMGDAVDGCLPSTFQPGFEEHMVECASCRTYLEHLRLTRQALQSLPRGSGTSSRRKELIKKFTEEFDRNRD
jgi:anti-sigma factor RsiW